MSKHARDDTRISPKSGVVKRSLIVSNGVTTLISPKIRSFSTTTVEQVAGWSRTTLWRRKYRGRLGTDVIGYIQSDRARCGLPALSDVEVAEVLAALVAVEDARIAKAAEQVAA